MLQWLNVLPAGLLKVTYMTWVQLSGVPNNLSQDQRHTCFEINFLD